MTADTLRAYYSRHAGKVSDKWQLYLDIYQAVLADYRDKPVSVLEVGIQNGGSLEIWSRYFRNAIKLVGCDINPDCARLRYDDPRIAVVVADANTDDAERRIAAEAEVFDIIIEEQLKSKIMRVQGVANVDIYGGRERKILVEIDKEKIDAYQISFERIMEVLGANNFNVLTGGITKGEKEFHIRAIGEFMDVADIGNIGVAITTHGSIIRLKQVARVIDSFLEPQDYARLNLAQNVSLYVKKESLANTISVTDNIKRTIQAFSDEYQKKGIAIIGMKVATRGRMISTWTPPPIEEQPARLATKLPGTITIKEALTYNMSLPVSTTIIGVNSVAQIEEDVKIASEFSPLSEAEMKEIEFKTLPIVRQGLYFRRWDMGA